MKSCLAVFVLVAVFCSAKGQKDISIQKLTSSLRAANLSSSIVSTSIVSTTSMHVSPSVSTTHITPKTGSFSSQSSATNTIQPNNTNTIQPINTNTIQPNNTKTIHPNVTQTTHHNSTHVPSKRTVVTLAPSHSMSPKPPPTKSAGKDDKDYDNMKKRMWIAASFAIIFSLTTVVLAYLVYRQRKINRELSGDPATSRLL